MGSTTDEVVETPVRELAAGISRSIQTGARRLPRRRGGGRCSARRGRRDGALLAGIVRRAGREAADDATLALPALEEHDVVSGEHRSRPGMMVPSS
jgi:hypothetical protein